MHTLEAKNLAKTIKKTKLVHDISLVVKSKEIVGLLGPNGAGKTTLFNLISGLLLPSSGQIHLFDQDVTRIKAHKRASLGLSRTFQVTNLFKKMTLFENIILAIQAVKRMRYCFHRTVGSFRETILEAENLLKDWDLWEKRDSPVEDLSYGEQRQIEVIMALATKPRLLLLDEPAAGLAPAERGLLTSTIKELPREITTILIEHDMDVAFEVSEKITVLYFGTVLADGPLDEIRGNPKVTEIYLG